MTGLEGAGGLVGRLLLLLGMMLRRAFLTELMRFMVVSSQSVRISFEKFRDQILVDLTGELEA